MILEVSLKNKKYEMNLEPFSQWGGNNIPLKTAFITSLTKHFSSSKYMEYESYYIENIKLDGVVPGRKRYHTIKIASKEDILKYIKLGKLSLFHQYINNLISSYDVQKEMDYIDDKLMAIFDIINTDVNINIPNISIDYSSESLWEMIQKSEVITSDGEVIEELSFNKALETLLAIIEILQKTSPESYLLILENLDHFVSKEEYGTFVAHAHNMVRLYDIIVICTTSLTGYISVLSENITGITIFNDEPYSLPDAENLTRFFYDNYPIYKEDNTIDIYDVLNNIIDKIGTYDILIDMTDIIYLKMINKTINARIKIKNNLSKPEWEYLFD